MTIEIAVDLFYNFVGEGTDHIYSDSENCPHCSAELTKLPGSIHIEEAILEGRTFVGTESTERRKE